MTDMSACAPADSLAAIAREALAQFLAPDESCESGEFAERIGALGEREPAVGSHQARLLKLAGTLGLGADEILAVAMCFEVERDPVFARQVALVQQPVGKARPMVGMLARIAGDAEDRVLALAQGKAVATGLLRLGDEEAPLGERSLSLPPHMVAALSGKPIDTPDFTLPTPTNVRLSRMQMDDARELAAFASHQTTTTLVIRSAMANEALALARSVAERMGKQIAVAREADDCRHAAWFASLGIVPCFEAAGGAGERWKMPECHAYCGPRIVLAGLEALIDVQGPVREYRLGTPSPQDREVLWLEHGLDEETAKRAARSYRQGSGRIGQLAARLAGSGSDWDSLKALVQAPSHDLGIAAQHIRTAKVTRDSLVLEPRLTEALDELVERAWRRDGLAEGLGPALTARYSPGVTALMCGESGTGKTLAAHWLAEQIGLPLYRVDMAALTSKWIGETEKNLSHLLATAEQADLILFFDEADSLFGARTDVSDSHDRYANAQTNFLLQRFEEFEGIALLSTNSRDRFDSAFVRRIDAILEFPLPDGPARRELWVQHLGKGHRLAKADLDLLAVEVDIAGGHIRNVVLGAAARAARGGKPIARGDIAAAVRREYAKLGKAGTPLEAW